MPSVHNIDPHVNHVIVAARAVNREANARVDRGEQADLTPSQRKLRDALMAYDRVLQVGELRRA